MKNLSSQFAAQFAAASLSSLVDSFNGQVGLRAWSSARATRDQALMAELFEAKVTSRYSLKRREIFCEFKKCFRKLETKTNKSIVPIFLCRQIDKCCRTPPYYN